MNEGGHLNLERFQKFMNELAKVIHLFKEWMPVKNFECNNFVCTVKYGSSKQTYNAFILTVK